MVEKSLQLLKAMREQMGGYIEEYADCAMSSRNVMFLITQQGIAAIDNA